MHARRASAQARCKVPSVSDDDLERFDAQLHTAAALNDAESAWEALAHGANLNRFRDKTLPLGRAAAGGHARLCRLFIALGAQVKLRSEIDFCVLKGHSYTQLVLNLSKINPASQTTTTTNNMHCKRHMEPFVC